MTNWLNEKVTSCMPPLSLHYFFNNYWNWYMHVKYIFLPCIHLNTKPQTHMLLHFNRDIVAVRISIKNEFLFLKHKSVCSSIETIECVKFKWKTKVIFFLLCYHNVPSKSHDLHVKFYKTRQPKYLFEWSNLVKSERPSVIIFVVFVWCRYFNNNCWERRCFFNFVDILYSS